MSDSVIDEVLSRGTFGFHDDIVEHLMNFCMVLLEIGKLLACQLEFLGLFVESDTDEHFQTGELQISE